MIMRDYFDPNPTYLEKYFHRRFWTHTSIFLTIGKVVDNHDDWFKIRSASEEINASLLMKCIAVVRVLVYGCSANVIDDYLSEERGWPEMLGSIDCMHWT